MGVPLIVESGVPENTGVVVLPVRGMFGGVVESEQPVNKMTTKITGKLYRKYIFILSSMTITPWIRRL